MSLAIAFWVLMLLWLVLGFVIPGNFTWKGSSGTLILFFIIAILGWKTFGAPIQ